MTLCIAACSTGSGKPRPAPPVLTGHGTPPESGLGGRDVRGLDEALRYLARGNTPGSGTAPPPDRPAAMIDGEPVAWDALHAALSEAAGAEVLKELALDARLSRRFVKVGLTVDPAMIEHERTLFAETAASAGISDADADAALSRLRRQRGLGPTRFAALLRRNAMLRALVQADVHINDAAVAQAYALRYGERFRARVITVATAHEASDVARRINAGEDFSRVAAEVSTDISATRGGVIDPISPADPSYPQALREALQKMTPGQVGAPIAVGDGFVVVTLDGRGAVPDGKPPPTLESVRSEMERVARLRQERLLMEQLARELGAGTDIRPLDPSLRWSIDAVK